MKNVTIDDFTHKELKSLCRSHKKSIIEYLRHGVLYFKKTGIDPGQSIIESPQKAIKELSRRLDQVIGVIKAQEQDKMNPLLEQLMMLVKRVEMLLGDAPKESTFKAVLTRTEEMIEADQTNHLQQLESQHKYYKQQMDSSEQRSTVTDKKLDEVLSRLDKMAEAIRT